MTNHPGLPRTSLDVALPDLKPGKPQTNQDKLATLDPGVFTWFLLLSVILSTLQRELPALESH